MVSGGVYLYDILHAGNWQIRAGLGRARQEVLSLFSMDQQLIIPVQWGGETPISWEYLSRSIDSEHTQTDHLVFLGDVQLVVLIVVWQVVWNGNLSCLHYNEIDPWSTFSTLPQMGRKKILPKYSNTCFSSVRGVVADLEQDKKTQWLHALITPEPAVRGREAFVYLYSNMISVTIQLRTSKNLCCKGKTGRCVNICSISFIQTLNS